MTFLFDLIKTICLGIIQGITEWFPISSTGDLLIFNSIWPMLPAEFFDVFKVVIQFGSILAVLYLFHHRLNPWDKSKTEKEKIRTYNLWIKVIVGVIPAAVIGLLLNDIIDEYLSQNFVIAVALIAYGIIFIIVEQHPKKPTIKSIYRMDYKTALKIGFFQCLALIPGTSRSGATILGGLLSGCTRTLASEYSFFIAIPTMFGASLLKVVKYLTNTGMFTLSQLILLLVGTGVSYIVSLFAIRALLDYVKTHDFKVFGWYRIILGCFIILFFYIL